MRAGKGALEARPDVAIEDIARRQRCDGARQQQDQGNRNPDPALEQIKKAIALSPQSPAPYYYLGQIRKACGDQVEAEKMFRKTVELRPDHIEANRELRLIQMRRGKGDETVSGRLFGRKKK